MYFYFKYEKKNCINKKNNKLEMLMYGKSLYIRFYN